MTELEKALMVIRDECKKHEVCSECPLRTGNNSNVCKVNDTTPEKWQLRIEHTAGHIPSVFD